MLFCHKFLHFSSFIHGNFMVICFSRKGVISNENMDMRRGHYTVDAKSLFGILNLGLERKIELKVYDENCDALFEDIAQYVAA